MSEKSNLLPVSLQKRSTSSPTVPLKFNVQKKKQLEKHKHTDIKKRVKKRSRKCEVLPRLFHQFSSTFAAIYSDDEIHGMKSFENLSRFDSKVSKMC